jgi:predicted transcriptional regulator
LSESGTPIFALKKLAADLLALDMRPYKASHNTGVTAYETSADSITLKFRDGSTYLYTNKSAGAGAIAEMKKLAERGEGLTTYVNQHVRDHYEKKVK